MIALFLLLCLLCAYAIQATGAWSETSPRLHDLLAMTLLMLLALVLAMTFAPFTEVSSYQLPAFYV